MEIEEPWRNFYNRYTTSGGARASESLANIYENEREGLAPNINAIAYGYSQLPAPPGSSPDEQASIYGDPANGVNYYQRCIEALFKDPEEFYIGERKRVLAGVMERYRALARRLAETGFNINTGNGVSDAILRARGTNVISDVVLDDATDAEQELAQVVGEEEQEESSDDPNYIPPSILEKTPFLSEEDSARATRIMEADNQRALQEDIEEIPIPDRYRLLIGPVPSPTQPTTGQKKRGRPRKTAYGETPPPTPPTTEKSAKKTKKKTALVPPTSARINEMANDLPAIRNNIRDFADEVNSISSEEDRDAAIALVQDKSPPIASVITASPEERSDDDFINGAIETNAQNERINSIDRTQRRLQRAERPEGVIRAQVADEVKTIPATVANQNSVVYQKLVNDLIQYFNPDFISSEGNPTDGLADILFKYQTTFVTAIPQYTEYLLMTSITGKSPPGLINQPPSETTRTVTPSTRVGPTSPPRITTPVPTRTTPVRTRLRTRTAKPPTPPLTSRRRVS